MSEDDKRELLLLLGQAVIEGGAGAVLVKDGEDKCRAWESAIGGALLGAGAATLARVLAKFASTWTKPPQSASDEQ